jgi:hypothetical protein
MKRCLNICQIPILVFPRVCLSPFGGVLFPLLPGYLIPATAAL